MSPGALAHLVQDTGQVAEAMTAIWTGHEASCKGQFLHFERIWSDPKPGCRDPIALERPARAGCGGPTIGCRPDRAAPSSGRWRSGQPRSASSLGK